MELPESLIQEEMRAVVEQTAGQLAQQGLDVRKLLTPDLVRSLLDTSRPEAEERLKARLALEALAEAEAIAVDPSAVEARVRELRLIAAEQPRYNRRSRRPEAQTWLKLTVESAPRLSVVRTVADPESTGARYLGPFPSRHAAQAAAEALVLAHPLQIGRAHV